MDEKKLKLLLGIKIKEQRNRLNLTQEDFSELIGISQRQVSLIELGKSFPKPITLVKISKVFSCSVSDLFNFELNIDEKELKENVHNLVNRLTYEKLKILYVIGNNI